MTRIFVQRRELAALRDLEPTSADVRECLGWLTTHEPTAAEYHPPLDLIETADAIEIVADLPGVPADAVRIIFTGGLVVLAGRKAPPGCDRGGVAFHQAERTYGRFVCVIRLGAAVDAGRASATLKHGVLTVRLPRIEDRRGRDLPIAIESA